jgi:hypothetical protein
VEGVAVTPVGRAEIEMLMVLLNPFAATAETVVCWPEAPVVRVRLVGLMVREKSGGGAAVTLSVRAAVWDSEPEVPVTVRVLELVAAVAAAVRVMVCGAPGVTVTDAGAAVTPVGRPERATATEEAKPLIATAVTVTCCVVAPSVRAIDVGAAEREKSATALELEPQPMPVKARQFRANSQRLNMRMRELEFFSRARV